MLFININENPQKTPNYIELKTRRCVHTLPEEILTKTPTTSYRGDSVRERRYFSMIHLISFKKFFISSSLLKLILLFTKTRNNLIFLAIVDNKGNRPIGDDQLSFLPGWNYKTKEAGIFGATAPFLWSWPPPQSLRRMKMQSQSRSPR